MVVTLKDKISVKTLLGIMISIMIAFLSESSVFSNTIYQKILWTILAIIGLVSIYCNRNRESIKIIIGIACIVPLPFILATLYTIVYRVIVGDQMGIILQSASTTLFIIVDILMVLGLLLVWKKEAFHIMKRAVIISYAITLIRAVSYGGIYRMWLYIVARSQYPDWFFNSYYERHDIGVAVVPLIMYYIYQLLFSQEKKKKADLFSIIALIVILLMCGKRGAMLGVGVGVGLLFAYKYIKKQYIIKISKILLFCTFMFAFIYICLIRTGVMEEMLQMFGINSMGRLDVFNWFSDQYSISPLYVGKGFQYVHRYMMLGKGTVLVNAFGYLHNSILQIYIETGFWGFVIWFGILLGVMPKMLKKFIGIKSYIFYVCIVLSMISMYTVDNVLTYPVYTVCAYVALGEIMLAEKMFERIIY